MILFILAALVLLVGSGWIWIDYDKNRRRLRRARTQKSIASLERKLFPEWFEHERPKSKPLNHVQMMRAFENEMFFGPGAVWPVHAESAVSLAPKKVYHCPVHGVHCDFKPHGHLIKP